jgi:hypothetical protein
VCERCTPRELYCYIAAALLVLLPLLSICTACMLHTGANCLANAARCLRPVEFSAVLPNDDDATMMMVNGRVSPRHVSLT